MVKILLLLPIFFLMTNIYSFTSLNIELTKKQWQGQYTLDKSTGYKSNSSLLVEDNSSKGGTYAISKPAKIIPGQDYEISCWNKTNGKVSSEAVMYLRVLDSTGKVLKNFKSSGNKLTKWEKLYLYLPAKNLPKEASSIQIMLTSATGPAKETGKAWFSDVKLISSKRLEQTKGFKWEGQYSFEKSSGYKNAPALRIKDNTLRGGTYAITKPVKIIPRQDYEISCWNKTNGKVSSEAVMYLRVLDSTGKILKNFKSSGNKLAKWERLYLYLPAGNFPKGAAAVQIMLTAATGAAKETGEAWFSDVELIFSKCLEQTKSLKWDGQYTFEKSSGYNNAPALRISDNSMKGGTYAISEALAINTLHNYELTAWCRTNDKVTTAAAMYLRIFDSAGKTLKIFRSSTNSTSEWKKLNIRLLIDKWPKGASFAKIMLTAAVGAAKETGVAWFSDVKFDKMPDPPVKPANAIDITDKLFIKSLPANTPAKYNGNFINNNYTKLELSWRKFHKLLRLDLRSKANIPVNLSYWDDQAVEWREFGKTVLLPSKINGYTSLDLSKLPVTRKILLNFGQVVSIGNLKLYASPELTEYWKAGWIWFTKERREFVTRYFRKSFVVEGEIDNAFFQGTGDDHAEFFINGRKVLTSINWYDADSSGAATLLKPGENVISAIVKNHRYEAGIIAELDINYKSGKSQKIVTDSSWRSTGQSPAYGWQTKGFDDKSWVKSILLCFPPDGVWKNIPYRLYSRRKTIKLNECNLPEKISATDKLELKFKLNFPQIVTTEVPVYLKISRDGITFLRKKLIDGLKNKFGELQLKTAINFGAYLYPGNYKFSLEIPYYAVMSNGKEWKKTVSISNNHRPKSLSVKMKKIDTIPTIHINGKPIWNMGYTILGRDQSAVKNSLFNSIGMRIVHCYENPRSQTEGKYDFAAIDKAVFTILSNNPNALIILKPGFRTCVPNWFLKKYPDEAVVFDAGRKLNKPSLASEKWRKVAGEMLSKTIQHINNGPYADKIIGYFVREGEEGQWMHYWGGSDLSKENILSDYSKPMREYFRIWLKNKYLSIDNLRKAWKNNKVTFESACIPSRQERIAPNKGTFRDPLKNRKAIDYAEALSDVICDGISYYARIVKRETENNALMLTFYGHFVDAGGCFWAEQMGYIKQRRLINNPDIDCIANPIAYTRALRDIGGFAGFDYPAPGSLRLQNKMYINEADVRTHLTYPPGYAYSVRTQAQTEQVLAREFAKALCGGAGMYWLNLGGGIRDWFDDIDIVRSIARLNKIAQEAVKDDLSSISETAVIMSDKSLLYMRQLNSRSPEDCISQQCNQQRIWIAAMGAPFDEYLADDFLDAKMPDYKLYIFLNTFYMSEQERKAVVAKLKKNKATALWFYAPGYINKNGFSLAAIAELTGIKIDRLNKRDNGRIKIEAGNSLLKGYDETIGLPSGISMKPIFFAVDKAVEVLGRLQSNNETAFVIGKRAGFTSYYCSTPFIPSELLRSIAMKAGVHIYDSHNDAVYACKDYLAVHSSKKAALRKIKLPEVTELIQIYPNYKEMGKVKEFEFESKSPQTRIYKIKR